MPRKTPSTTPTVRQGDPDPDALAMGGHLAQLNRLEARQHDQEADDLEELRQAWAPALTQAKTLLSELSALQEAYTPALEAIARRDFAALPPMARTLNAVAAIERTCQEIQHHCGHTVEDLRRIVAAVEQLNERSAPLLHANASTYRELLAFYRHSPQGVRELFQRLQHLVASLTAGVELAPSEETYTPVRRLPSPQPLVPEVEIA
jgi:ABC-type transporter Mla subunit MlaD